MDAHETFDVEQEIAIGAVDGGGGDHDAAFDGIIPLRVTALGNAALGLTYGCFRYRSLAEHSLGSTGTINDGAVENYAVVIGSNELHLLWGKRITCVNALMTNGRKSLETYMDDPSSTYDDNTLNTPDLHRWILNIGQRSVLSLWASLMKERRH